jgi:hypothetical protein
VWEAFYRLDPWGDDWTQAACIEAAIKNQHATDPVNPYDLIPNEDNRPKEGEATDADVRQGFRGMAGL